MVKQQAAQWFVRLDALDELFTAQLLVATHVELLDDLVHSVVKIVSLVLLAHIEHGKEQIEHILQLLAVNVPIAIRVVDGEGEIETLVQLALGSDVEGEQELGELNRARVVRVESVKDELGVLVHLGISWLELLVQFDELFLVQSAVRAVLRHTHTQVDHR